MTASAWKPSDFYHYELDGTADLPARVTACAGAGKLEGPASQR
ncbi:hypothetical protein [Paracidovorax cattleyae]|nr:hypothetical protein [Paracidovorax cattleyae]